MKINSKPDSPPDTALIEYLGDYEDAAEGLDPMGLADPPAIAAKPDKQGRQP